jgi:hypothetical protein
MTTTPFRVYEDDVGLTTGSSRLFPLISNKAIKNIIYFSSCDERF